MTSTHTVAIPGLGISPAKRALLEARLAGRGPASAIPRRDAGGEAPLTFAQERFWFLERLGQGGAAYTIPKALRLSGPLDAAALERALGEVVRRHGALRTTFREVDGTPAQVVAPFAGFTLPVDDLSALPGPDREAELRRRAAAEAADPFDLVAGPLFRARLLRLEAQAHVLLITLHHIVGDGWSVGVLFRELWALYHAAREGRPVSLPEPPLQYADWAAWEREQARGPAQARQLAWWRERLAGAPEVLELPSDHPRPPTPSLRGESVPVFVPASVADRLRALARAEGATLFMVVLAAFQALLARYAGTPDVVVGTPVAGRTRREVEEVVGLFMNLLVLRTDLSGDPAFRQALARARETVLGAYEHQDVPFERLVDELRPERSLSHATVFQVVFQLDTEEGGEGGGGEVLRVEGMDAAGGTAKLDLSLELDAHAHGITGLLTYSTDLFERGTARRMAEQLEWLLEQVSADPGRRLSRLELMGRAERKRVLEWNHTTAAFPATRCIHQLFEEQAARTPHAVALVPAQGDPLTFAELDARANRLAHHLAALGAGPEVRVGLLLERGPALLAALLGVMKAGGAYVPLDRAYPDDRLAYMLADSGVRVLLTQESLRGRVTAPGGAAVVSVDGDAAAIAAEPSDAPPASAVTSENLAYVIYTSGSTGRPKGVAMHHRGVCNYIHWGIRAYGADAGNGAPVFTSMAVDLTITNLLPLFAGRPVRLLDEDAPVEALAAALRARPGFGVVKITPVHLSLLTPLLTPEEAREAARTLVIGADFLSAEPTVFWQDNAPGVRLMNEYGPTETVVGCSAYLLPPGRHRAGPVPVGHPIQNLRFYVLDAHLQPVPVGFPGELHIGGAGVARGYLGRPALTAEKFVPDPFAGGGARMYRTGDRARWLANGNLLILGRTDNQVKIRGYRVEPGEVEAVLRRHPAVRDCLVVVRDDTGDRRLVAYVVGGADAAALREHVARSLPEYMVPSAFVALASLPQTATGKLDPRALPAPVYGAAHDEIDEPRSYLEVRLIQLWEELLGVDEVGPTDNFFTLGGNSFLALRLFSKVNRALGCDLPVATLFTDATVRHMAGEIAAQRAEQPSSAAPVVSLQPSGTLPPVFFIHSSDRNVMGYVSLVRHLGAGQPAYGVRDVGEDMARPVERIAAEHVAAIRAVQPKGPYYLAGWSFGGFVAYEMARQLEAAGELPAFVGLLDTVSPVYARRWPLHEDLDIAIGLAGEAAARMRRPVSIPRAPLEGLGWEEQTRRIIAHLEAHGAAPPGFDAAELRADCRAIRDRSESLNAYQVGPCGATLTLFQAAETPPEIERVFAHLPDEERRTRGWSALAPGRVEVHRVPGVHATLATEPNVRVLAERMRDALAAARGRAGAHAAAQATETAGSAAEAGAPAGAR